MKWLLKPKSVLSQKNHPFTHSSFLGFTLLELMLVLGSVATLSAVTWIGYNHYSQGQKAQLAVQDSLALANTLSNTYGQTGSFANISTNSVKNANLAPSNLIKTGTLKGPWGGPVDISPGSVNSSSFAITWSQVPSGGCTQLVSQLFKAFPIISVNGQNIDINNGKVDVGQVTNACQSASNTVVLTSQPLSSFADTGEVGLPTDSGNKTPPPPVAPPTQGVKEVSGVNAVVYTPTVIQAPTPLNTPTATNVPVTGASVQQTSGSSNSGPPPIALPPQSCFPSSKDVPVNTPVTQTRQGPSCPVGSVGSITEQETGTKTDTTTTTTTCATNWSNATVTTTTSTQTTWNDDWKVISNTCAPVPTTASITNSNICIASGNDSSNGGGANSCGQTSASALIYSGATPTCTAKFTVNVGASSQNETLVCNPDNSGMTATTCSATYTVGGSPVKVAISLNFDSNNEGVGTTTQSACGGYEITYAGKCTHEPGYTITWGGPVVNTCVW